MKHIHKILASLAMGAFSVQASITIEHRLSVPSLVLNAKTAIPTVTASFHPKVIRAGQKSTLHWASTEVDALLRNGASVLPNGSEEFHPNSKGLIVSDFYARNGLGNTSTKAELTVLDPEPTVSVTWSPQSALPGHPIRLNWQATHTKTSELVGLKQVDNDSGMHDFIADPSNTEFTLNLHGDDVVIEHPLSLPITPRDNRSCKTLKSQDSTLDSGMYDTTDAGRVMCDMEWNGGGWTVIQNRISDTNFYQVWSAYKQGFGSYPNVWLGNDKIHTLTKSGLTELAVIMSNHSGDTRYARYSKFSIANEAAKYQLSVSGYSGNAGDSLSGHNGNYFSTYDRDNDNYAEGSCARQYKAGNWYGRCHASNLNGIYHNGEHTSYADGVNWVTFEGYYYSLKTSTMMVR